VEPTSQNSIRAFFAYLKNLKETFSPRINFLALVLFWVGCISLFVVLWQINKGLLIEIPAKGGEITEGIVGIPRFINPLLAVSDADRDMTTLVYAGLMRAEGSVLVPDLAENYTVSEDGLTYTFVLREGITFHDGTPITADDVEFTVLKAKDPALKSPKRANWEGVAVEKIDDRTINFTLKQPYSPFLENTTLGIMPRAIWKNADPEQFSFSEFNVEPVGSGPYKITGVSRNGSGIPSSYTLVPFSDYSLGEPYIQKVTIHFYTNEANLLKALRSGEVQAVNAIAPETAEILSNEGFQVLRAPLPRVFGVFFNQNQAPVLAEAAVREALNVSAPREEIVSNVLHGYGSVIWGPIPPGSRGYVKEDEKAEEDRIVEARDILETAGWEAGEDGIYTKAKSKKETLRLSFSIETSDVPELKAVSDMLKNEWTKIGAEVEVKVFESGDLNQNVIRPRKYDALLFGEIVGRDSDLFAFWHSSQRNDPGLNIALYTNSATDKALEDMRRISDPEKRDSAYTKFLAEISDDTPAVFLYAPEFTYVFPKNVRGVSLGTITVPSDRFFGIYKWYIDTDLVWKVFAQN